MPEYYGMTSIFPYTNSNIPLLPTYDVYVSELIRCKGLLFIRSILFSPGRLLTDTLMIQGYLQSCLMSALCKLYYKL
jgi:hypothetical protein